MVLTRLVTSIIWWYFVQNTNEYRFLGLLNAQEQGLGICIFIRTSQRLETTGLGDTLEKNVTAKGPPTSSRWTQELRPTGLADMASPRPASSSTPQRGQSSQAGLWATG